MFTTWSRDDRDRPGESGSMTGRSTRSETMSGHSPKTTVGALPDTAESPYVPVALTWLAWSLFAASVGVLLARIRFGGPWEIPGVVAVDGLTALLWVAVAFFSGIVHSYSRRYMAGSSHEAGFFVAVFVFTVAVMGLLAADHVAFFGLLWLAMGLVMARLIGLHDDWKQARTAAATARRYFLASSALLGVALAALWWATGATTISGIAAAADTLGGPVGLLATGALVLAAMIQSALIPFHTWLLASMTAPTPASALMHAGFVNAGGILLVRFAPVVALDPTVMLLIVVVGTASALLGNLFKSVQVDAKTRLGSSTVGQMGFMIMQAGLGFFAAAIAHLVLHGFYKAYLFLAAGEEIEHTSPADTVHTTGSVGPVGRVVTVLAALAGGVLFAALTGKGTSPDGGLLLTGLVALTTLHATRSALRSSTPRATYRHGVVPLLFLPAIAVYALAYNAVETVMTDLPLVTAPVELTPVHGVVAVAFLVGYVATETGVYRRNDRLYVALVNATQAPSRTLLTSREEYNEY
jgi:NAD(P)H-quinone oxidoreductase subunit 5